MWDKRRSHPICDVYLQWSVALLLHSQGLFLIMACDETQVSRPLSFVHRFFSVGLLFRAHSIWTTSFLCEPSVQFSIYLCDFILRFLCIRPLFQLLQYLCFQVLQTSKARCPYREIYDADQVQLLDYATSNASSVLKYLRKHVDQSIHALMETRWSSHA